MLAQTESRYLMPEINLIGWRTKITDYCDANGISRSKGQVKRMACQIHKRMEAMARESTMSEDELFFAGLRILGMIPDDTARMGVQRIQTRATLRRMAVAA